MGKHEPSLHTGNGENIIISLPDGDENPMIIFQEGVHTLEVKEGREKRIKGEIDASDKGCSYNQKINFLPG